MFDSMKKKENVFSSFPRWKSSTFSFSDDSTTMVTFIFPDFVSSDGFNSVQHVTIDRIESNRWSSFWSNFPIRIERKIKLFLRFRMTEKFRYTKKSTNCPNRSTKSIKVSLKMKRSKTKSNINLFQRHQRRRSLKKLRNQFRKKKQLKKLNFARGEIRRWSTRRSKFEENSKSYFLVKKCFFFVQDSTTLWKTSVWWRRRRCLETRFSYNLWRVTMEFWKETENYPDATFSLWSRFEIRLSSAFHFLFNHNFLS